MKVIFAIPAGNGQIEVRCTLALVATFKLLWEKGIDAEIFTISDCPYVSVARNTLVSMFMEDKDATDLFFIDADVEFDPEGVLKLLDIEDGIVAGIYPLKRDLLSFPVEIKVEDNVPMGRPLEGEDEYLIEAAYLPTGFMRIKRWVLEKMQEAYPELKYDGNVVAVSDAQKRDGYDLFNMGIELEAKRWISEDYAFCNRWKAIGGQLWVYPNLDFGHTGTKTYIGNYQKYLRKEV